MAMKARAVNKAVKNAVENDGTRRKRRTGATAGPGGAAQPKQRSQAELAIYDRMTRSFEGNFAYHGNCIAHLASEGKGMHVWVFEDGSAIRSVDFSEAILPRNELLQYLPELLLSEYADWVEYGEREEFTLWIAGDDGFEGTPKEAFEKILRKLGPPASPSKKALSLIESGTAYMQSLRIDDQAWDDVERLNKTVERLVACGLIERRAARALVDSAYSLARAAKVCAAGENSGQAGGRAA
jgi:hypothetical protein